MRLQCSGLHPMISLVFHMKKTFITASAPKLKCEKKGFFHTSVKSLMERQWKRSVQVHAIIHTQSELLATADGQKSQQQTL